MFEKTSGTRWEYAEGLQSAVARFTTISCLHLNGGAIPGVIRQ